MGESRKEHMDFTYDEISLLLSGLGKRQDEYYTGDDWSDVDALREKLYAMQAELPQPEPQATLPYPVAPSLPCDVCGEPSVSAIMVVTNNHGYDADISQCDTKVLNRCAEHQGTTASPNRVYPANSQPDNPTPSF